MTLVALGPLPCLSCRKTVTWVRTDGRWTLLEGTEKHRCEALVNRYPDAPKSPKIAA